VSSRDRVYAAERSPTLFPLIDPAANKLLGCPAGDPQPAKSLTALRGQVLVHGLGFSPDQPHARGDLHRFQLGHLHRHGDQRRQARHYLGRLTLTKLSSRRMEEKSGSRCAAGLRRGCSTAKTFSEKADQARQSGPGNDHLLARRQVRLRVLQLFTPETAIVSVADHKVVGKVKQESPFCRTSRQLRKEIRSGSPSKTWAR